MKEMALDFSIKVRVEVVTSRDHPVLREIFGQMRVQRFIDVVAVISSELKFFCEAITPHGEPGADIERDRNGCRSQGQNHVERRPPVFPGKVEFSFFELGILCGDKKGSDVLGAGLSSSVEGFNQAAGANGQSFQRGSPAQITAVNLASVSGVEHQSLVGAFFEVSARQIEIGLSCVGAVAQVS